ncbi:MAG: DUF47 family protein [Oligoflexia bacterium]|nr:DUF47 family protein [Oligoflexia bacterium]
MLKFLKKLLPPEEKLFYAFFGESIALTHDAAILLADIYESGMTEEKLDKARELKDKSAEVTHRTLERLNLTFVTPFDREDIQTVAVFINKITKKITKAIKNSKYYQLKEFNDYLRKEAKLLVQITNELKHSVETLKKDANPRLATASGKKIHDLESVMDGELKDAIENLFSNQQDDALTMVKLGRLYRDIESVVESCSTLADIILNIVLKNS